MTMRKSNAFRKAQNDESALERTHGGIDCDSLLDLLTAIEDDRRLYDSIALRAADPSQCAQYRAMARADAGLIANVRHDMAVDARRHLSRRARERRLDRYARLLISKGRTQ